MITLAIPLPLREQPFSIVIEPWAVRYEVPAGGGLVFTARHPAELPVVRPEHIDDGLLIVWVERAAHSWELHRNGELFARM